jgi:hypothetical protein
MSAAGEGGNITDVLFDGATFIGTNQAASIKSLAVFVGTVRCLVVLVVGFCTLEDAG